MSIIINKLIVEYSEKYKLIVYYFSISTFKWFNRIYCEV